MILFTTKFASIIARQGEKNHFSGLANSEKIFLQQTPQSNNRGKICCLGVLRVYMSVCSRKSAIWKLLYEIENVFKPK